MQNKIANAFIRVAVLATLGMPLFAQNQILVKVHVPFNFVVENQRLSPGDYSIGRLQNGRLLFRNDDGTVTATVLSFPLPLKSNATESQVMFHRYGTEYFLSEIRVRGQNSGREVLRGKEETEIASRKIPRVLASLAAR